MKSMTDDELKRLLEATAADMRRHFDVNAERTDQRFDQLAEAVASVDEKLDSHVNRLDGKIDRGFAETQAMIKFSHDELDRRIRALEQNQHTLKDTVSDLQTRVKRLEGAPH